jgi:hypothetical protein
LTGGSPPHDINDSQYGFDVKCLDSETFAEIEEMEKQRKHAEEALEISGDDSQPLATRSAKCQKCGRWVPLLSEPNHPQSHETERLQNTIKNLEVLQQKHLKFYDGDINADEESKKRRENKLKTQRSEARAKEITRLKDQLDTVLEEHAKHEFKRSLPLHYIQGKFRCYNCID